MLAVWVYRGCLPVNSVVDTTTHSLLLVIVVCLWYLLVVVYIDCLLWVV